MALKIKLAVSVLMAMFLGFTACSNFSDSGESPRNGHEPKQSEPKSLVCVDLINEQGDGVQRLLERGLDLTALFHAVNADDLTLFQYLVQKGARVGGRNNQGQNLMHSARSTQMAEALRQAKVALDETDANGQTPLSQAIRHGQLDMVRYLVTNGANVQWLSDKKETLLHLAVSSGGMAVVKYLLEIPLAVNARDASGRSPLFNAASVSLIDLLVRAGANVNGVDKKGQSVLASFIEDYTTTLQRGILLLIAKLLVYEADPNGKNERGELLLHAIVQMRPVSYNQGARQYLRAFDASELLKTFLASSRLNVDLKDLNDEVVLHKADTPQEVELLIESGAELNSVDRIKKQTPLQKKQADLEAGQAELEILTKDIADHQRMHDEAEALTLFCS